ncbi:MAG: hypothetical protein ACR2NS_11120 [Gemmatimonadaceae bacterium]
MRQIALRALFLLLRLLRPRHRAANAATFWLKKEPTSGPFDTY